MLNYDHVVEGVDIVFWCFESGWYARSVRVLPEESRGEQGSSAMLRIFGGRNSVCEEKGQKRPLRDAEGGKGKG